MPVSVIVGSIADSDTPERIIAAWPQLTGDDINAALKFAAEAGNTADVIRLCRDADEWLQGEKVFSSGKSWARIRIKMGNWQIPPLSSRRRPGSTDPQILKFDYASPTMGTWQRSCGGTLDPGLRGDK